MEDSQVAVALSAQLAERIGAQRFDLWFNSQTELCVRGLSLVVRSASAFVRDWLRTNFAEDIRACWEAIVGAAGTIEFSLGANQSAGSEGVAIATVDVAAVGVKSRPAGIPAAREAGDAEVGAECRPQKFALGAFVVGASNEYAFRAAELTSRGRQQASPLIFLAPRALGRRICCGPCSRSIASTTRGRRPST